MPIGASPAQPPVPEAIPIALMMDLSTNQVLYARESDRRFVPASVVKAMTAYTAFELIEDGAISPSTPFLITQELEDEWSGEGSTMFLKAGERPMFGELLLGATTISGNDASIALALAATGSVENWLALMNENAAALGMAQTHFGSANGYPDAGRTFTTANDLAILAEALTTHHPELYARYFGHRGLRWRSLSQANHDPISGQVLGADGIKTGYTREAGYTFLGSGERDGRRLVMVLAGARTMQMRDVTSREFITWGFEEFETQDIISAGAIVGTARVQEGANEAVNLQLKEDLSITLPRNHESEVQFSIRYHGPIEAPINQGEQVAQLRVLVEGMQPFEVPLEAVESVPAADFWQRIGNGIEGLLG